MISKLDLGDGTVAVTFLVPAAIWADGVFLVGSFNDWNTTSHPLRQGENGWEITVVLPAGQLYEYRYLSDGNEWHNDWQADRYVPNIHGGDNSVVDLTAFSTVGAQQERSVGQELEGGTGQ